VNHRKTRRDFAARPGICKICGAPCTTNRAVTLVSSHQHLT
jgi:hypothetical protein